MSLTELNVPILPVVSNACMYIRSFIIYYTEVPYLYIHLMCFLTLYNSIYKGDNFLCVASDLLPVPVSGDCYNDLCVEFSSTSVGDIATYSTTSDYCINSTSGPTRECLDTGLWSGNMPITLKGTNTYTYDMLS